MPDNRLILGATTVAQVVAVTAGTVEVNDIFTITLSDDAGNSHPITHTAGAATTTDVTAGLQAAAVAAKAAGRRPWTVVTTVDADPAITITADTAGVRFYTATTAVDGGGADTQTLVAALTTDNSGPADFLTAENWTLGRPVADQRLVIPVTTVGSLSYGLKSQAVLITPVTLAYAGIVVEKDCRVTIGNALQSLFLKLGGTGTEIQLAGKGQKFLQFETGSDDIIITQSSGDAGGRPGTVIDSTDDVDYSAKVTIASGQSVGFAVLPGQAMKINLVTLQGRGILTLGEGVTDDPVPELMEDTRFVSYCNLGNVKARGQSWIHWSGTLTKADMTAGNNALMSPDLVIGTTLNLYAPANLLMGSNAGAITTLTAYGQRPLQGRIDDPSGKIVNIALVESSPKDWLIFGKANRKWTQTAI